MMRLDLCGEAVTFLYAVICGGMCGICFDFFRAFRIGVKTGAFVSAIADSLFWICVSAVCGYFSFYISHGLLRAFLICGIGIGVLLYFLLISRVIFWLFLKIIEILYKILNLFLKILLTPWRFSYKIIHSRKIKE